MRISKHVFLYWFRFNALNVTIHLQRDRRFVWTRICGLQVGPWFFGCIKGSAVKETSR
jgi:hypothetical protein